MRVFHMVSRCGSRCDILFNLYLMLLPHLYLNLWGRQHKENNSEISWWKAAIQVHTEVRPSLRTSRSLTRSSLFVFHLASNLAWQLLCYKQLEPWRHVCSSHFCNSAITQITAKKESGRLQYDTGGLCALSVCECIQPSELEGKFKKQTNKQITNN